MWFCVCANFTCCFAVMQDYSAPQAWLSWERLQQKWPATNYVFCNNQASLWFRYYNFAIFMQWILMLLNLTGPASLGFCTEEPRANRQDTAVWYRASQNPTKKLVIQPVQHPFLHRLTIEVTVTIEVSFVFV